MTHGRLNARSAARLALLVSLALLWALAAGALSQDDPEGENGAPPGGDGWFTQEQADRGEAEFGDHCARCHSPDLRARSTYISLYRYPSLTGSFFRDRWRGESVHTLFEVIQQTMPLDAPGSLDDETYADITAHVLRENGFPGGEHELPTGTADTARLRGMVLEWEAARAEAGPQQVEQSEAAPAPDEERDEQPAARQGRRTEALVPRETPPEDDEEPAPDDGPWYTAAQAARAQDPFVENCARCHGRALQGLGVAPSLAGGNFIARWEGKPLADLFEIAVTLMPLDDPGSLDEQTYADLMALILQENGFEPGDEELPPDIDALQERIIRADLADVPEPGAAP